MAIAVTSAVSATTGTALLGSTSRPAASSRNSISLWATSTSLNRAFGLKTGHPRVTCSQSGTFMVTFKKNGREGVAEVGQNDTLMDAAKKTGLISEKTLACHISERPKCKKCRGKIIKGEPDIVPLGPRLADHIILTCQTYANSDMEIKLTGT